MSCKARSVKWDSCIKCAFILPIHQKKVRETIESTGSKISHHTQARNCNSPNTLAEQQQVHEDVMAEQIKAWRSILPTLIRKFSRIDDYRRTKSVKHKLVVFMIFGLLAFVFHLSSRREMNRELTGAVVNKQPRGKPTGYFNVKMLSAFS